MVSRQMRAGLNKREVKRQSIIWELIKGEMTYVKDLENIEVVSIYVLFSSVTMLYRPEVALLLLYRCTFVLSASPTPR